MRGFEGFDEDLFARFGGYRCQPALPLRGFFL